MATTRTGNFGIGFRRGWDDWQKDLGSLIQWAKENGFDCLDVGRDADAAKQVADAGLAVGSADLLKWDEMISADASTRDAAIAENTDYIEKVAACGVRNLFLVMLPENPGLERKENFDHMNASFAKLMPVLEANNARIVIEGWPGAGSLVCTPETYRAFITAMDSPAAAINYDPSHLIRMGIDPIRFLREFVDNVAHVHGKDTELLDERRYELGTELPAAFTPDPGFGGTAWRYTIPGQGVFRWTAAFKMLADAEYTGYVSIELEDENFNGTDEGEQRGLLLSRWFLEGC